MVEASSSAAGQRDATPMNDAPAAIGIGDDTSWAEGDDDSEWEYEYSATETETYYLTVELSLPEFKSASKKNPMHSRAGYYKTWLQNPQDVLGNTSTPMRTQDSTQPASPDEIEDPAEPEPAVVDDDMAIDPNLQMPPDVPEQKRKRSERHKNKKRLERLQDGIEKEDDSDDGDDEISTEDIQILELHSKRPIFSYRGRIFEGQWAENIGTEMILTNHDDESAATLPVLRNLAGDVDLLGASASRILTTEKVLKSKIEVEDTLGPIRKEWNINIPKGAYKMSERARQGNFLEQLIALKIKKGEKDQVTVYAKKADGKDNLNDNLRPKKKKKKKEKNDEPELNQHGRPKRRRKARGRLGQAVVPGILHGFDKGKGRDHTLSVPTPQRWSDLQAPGGAGRKNVTFDEQVDEDGDGSGENGSGDEEGDGQSGQEDEDQDEDDDDGDGDDGDDNMDEMDDDDDEDEEAPTGTPSNTAMAVD